VTDAVGLRLLTSGLDGRSRGFDSLGRSSSALSPTCLQDWRALRSTGEHSRAQRIPEKGNEFPESYDEKPRASGNLAFGGGAKSSRVACRKSIGTCTSNRCRPRSSEGRPGGCNGNPRKTRPRTPGRGDSDCSWEVMRPPNDLPPAKSEIRGTRRRARTRAARTVAWAVLGGSGRLEPRSM